ncbi:MAG: RNA-binding domain protein [Proteobacteria bacterium]|nr:RNA-binding domain protein [Pseudomonadota bacterium]
MPRPTLKLPAKPTTDDARSPRRKPLRGTSNTSKNAAAKRPPVTAQPAVATPRLKPETTPMAAPVRQPAPKPAEDRVRPTPRPPAPPAKKAYPKRGIARSTGARALPPPRIYDEDSAPRHAAAPISMPVGAPEAAPEPRPSVVTPRQAAPDAAPRRPLNEPPRLAKRISEMAQCSRRQADEWIENGWVRVDGVVVTTLGIRVHPNARIEIKEEASRHQSESVTILLNKPLDADDEAGGSLLSLIRAESRWSEDESRTSFKATHLRGLAQAGKLDAGSTGMVVFTQEGSVARRITGDETRLEKEYMVRVEGELSPEGMDLLNHGLELDAVKLKRAQVSWQNEQQLRFVLHESRPQQISRMCELVGLRVVTIKRIRIGSVSLGKLPVGQWRYLRDNERF